MKTEKLKIKDIKPNPDNPRVIRDWQFEKLKKSIQDFPQMLEIRPIVVDENNIILGGNQRFRALQDLGYKEIPIIRASQLTEEQKREFIIKDNTHWGRWDLEELYNNYSQKEVEDWNVIQGEQPNYIKQEQFNKELEEKTAHISKYPITILTNKDEYYKWESIKQTNQIKTDLERFSIILKNYD